MTGLTKADIACNVDLLHKVVSEHTTLDWMGYGKCPFHAERSASFNIFVAASGRARFHCFGCGADGDIFDFLLRAERVKFASALQRLRVMAGDISLVSSLPESAGLHSRATSKAEIGTDPFCERDCQRYANLREDYEILLDENQRLRAALGLPPFQPGESKIHTFPST